MIINNDDVTLTNVLNSCGVTEDRYTEEMRRMVSIIYSRKSDKTIISPYNTMLLNLIKFNTNLPVVTAVCGLLAYLCS